MYPTPTELGMGRGRLWRFSEIGEGGRGITYLFACLSSLTIDHASLSKRFATICDTTPTCQVLLSLVVVYKSPRWSLVVTYSLEGVVRR